MSVASFYKTVKERLRGYFIAGLLTIVPVSFTAYILNILWGKLDRVLNLLPKTYNPKSYIPFPSPGLGIALVLFSVLCVGILVENYLGRRVVSFGERVVCRIPLVRPLYSSIKQLLMAVFSQTGPSFKRVVLVEYPRKGIYSLAFVTGISSADLQLISGDRLINVFLPTTPNPTTGYFLLIPEREVISLQISTEDAFKLIISGGLVGPPEQDINSNDNLILPGAIAEAYPQVNKSPFSRLISLEAKEERKESIHVG